MRKGKVHWQKRYKRRECVTAASFRLSKETRAVSSEVVILFKHLPGLCRSNRTFDRLFLRMCLRERARLLRAYERMGLELPQLTARQGRRMAGYEKWKKDARDITRSDGADREL